MKYYLFVLIVIIFGLNSCVYDSEEALYPSPPLCDTITVSYNLEVNPILSNRCYSCHGNNNMVSVHEFEGHADLVKFLEKNLLLGAIKRLPGFLTMPQGGEKLPACEINIIEAWVNQGKLNN